jgi:hypothetical protein
VQRGQAALALHGFGHSQQGADRGEAAARGEAAEGQGGAAVSFGDDRHEQLFLRPEVVQDGGRRHLHPGRDLAQGS